MAVTLRLAHGHDIDDNDIPVAARWGVGGAIAQKFANQGFFVALTTRSADNAAALETAIRDQGHDAVTVELDLVSEDSIAQAFAEVRAKAGEPDVVVLNAGYLEGRGPAAGPRAPRAYPGRDVRNRTTHRKPRALPSCQGGASCNAQSWERIVPHHKQLSVVARAQANDRTVALLSASDDADACTGVD